MCWMSQRSWMWIGSPISGPPGICWRAENRGTVMSPSPSVTSTSASPSSASVVTSTLCVVSRPTPTTARTSIRPS